MIRPTRTDAAGRAYLDLQNQARRQQRGTEELPTLYTLERFLARLANDGQVMLNLIAEIAAQPAHPDDGARFDPSTAKAGSIREADLYTGIRIAMNAQISTATVKLGLDINFGDPITPAPKMIDYPALLPGMPAVRLLGYPIHTVLAEKITTAINLGATNTRVRDYLDLWALTGIHDLQAADVTAALRATATHRGIALRPLSESIADLATSRSAAYTAYLRRLGPDGRTHPESFAVIVKDVITFADPLLTLSTNEVAHWAAATRTWTSHSIG